MTCEVYLSTPPVGYSGSPSTVNETNCNKKVTFKKKYYELHQLQSDVSHNESLEEECHLLYCCGEIGSAISSPDSRWRRFFYRDCSSKIWSKSHWPVFAWLIQCEIPLSLVSFEFLCREMVRVILFCKFVHLYALLFRPTDCELWFTIDLVSEKSIVNTFEMFTLRVNSFAASLPRIPGCMVLFLFFSFAVTSTMATPFLDHVVRDRESIQS